MPTRSIAGWAFAALLLGLLMACGDKPKTAVPPTHNPTTLKPIGADRRADPPLGETQASRDHALAKATEFARAKYGDKLEYSNPIVVFIAPGAVDTSHAGGSTDTPKMGNPGAGGWKVSFMYMRAAKQPPPATHDEIPIGRAFMVAADSKVTEAGEVLSAPKTAP